MQNQNELLYQIRGLARCIVAFALLSQGIIPILHWLMELLNESSLSDVSWPLYLSSAFNVGLATWLIMAFTEKKPLWASSGFLILSFFAAVIFQSGYFFDNHFLPSHLFQNQLFQSHPETTLNIIIVTIALLALMRIDLQILTLQKTQTEQRSIGQYIHVTRDRMLYALIKQLELKDIPPLIHRLVQSRIKRHLQNRRQTKYQRKISEQNHLILPKKPIDTKDKLEHDANKIANVAKKETE